MKAKDLKLTTKSECGECSMRLRYALLEIGRLRASLDEKKLAEHVQQQDGQQKIAVEMATPSVVDSTQVRTLRYELIAVRREAEKHEESSRLEKAGLREALHEAKEDGRRIWADASTLASGVGKGVNSAREILTGLESALTAVGVVHYPGVPRFISSLGECVSELIEALESYRNGKGVKDTTTATTGGRSRDLFAETLRGACSDALRDNAHLRAQVMSQTKELAFLETALMEASGHESLARELKATLETQRGCMASLEAQLAGERARGSAQRLYTNGLVSVHKGPNFANAVVSHAEMSGKKMDRKERDLWRGEGE